MRAMLFRVVVVAMSIGCLILGPPGCVSAAKDLPNTGAVGATWDQSADKQTIKNGSPVTVGAISPTGAIVDADGKPILDKESKPIVPNESVAANGTGPSFYSLTNARETRAAAANTVLRSIYFARTPDGNLAINSTSGTDLRAGADEFQIDPKTGVITGKGFKLETLASTPFEASNASLQAWQAVALAMTQEQRAAIVAKLDADREVAIKAWGVASEGVSNLTKIISILKNPAAALPVP